MGRAIVQQARARQHGYFGLGNPPDPSNRIDGYIWHFPCASYRVVQYTALFLPLSVRRISRPDRHRKDENGFQEERPP